MAGSSFLLLLDDIASVMDDVAVLSKIAAKKTSGVLGDDLALNAQQVTGVSSQRELPVIVAVAKGSFFNKCILVPLALFISAVLPILVTPLLMIGGAFLCFEGVEKVLEKILLLLKSPIQKKEAEEHYREHLKNLAHTPEELIQLEKTKIKGAIRTDFILSAEIIVISLGIVALSPLLTKFLVLSSISLIMTIGVYGLVAMIVKIDDFGLYLIQKKHTAFIGKGLLRFAPILMKALSVLGTLAMFLVGGGIVAHGIPFLHHFTNTQVFSHSSAQFLFSLTLEGLIGVGVGLLVLGLYKIIKKLMNYK